MFFYISGTLLNLTYLLYRYKMSVYPASMYFIDNKTDLRLHLSRYMQQRPVERSLTWLDPDYTIETTFIFVRF